MNLLKNAALDWENGNARMTQSAPRADLSDMGHSEHFVQFYEEDKSLVESVAAFIGAGFRDGQSAIVLATRAHLNSLEKLLQNEGIDTDQIANSGRYFPLDASETLAKFMVNGSPDAGRFAQVVGGLIARATKSGGGLRAFGEMVALLWAEGNHDAALRLEQLWNELGKTHRFSLFCAYPLDGFRGEANSAPFVHICQEHSRVIPAESYSAGSGTDERLRTITLLQQKAMSLESEILERRHAEAALRAEQAKLSMATTIAGLGIWELDLETHLLTCSDQCNAHFGQTPAETLTYQRMFELIHPEDRATVENAFRAAMEAGIDLDTEYRVIQSGGELRWVAAMGQRVRNGKSRILGVTLDITSRRSAEEVLKRTVAERTTQLQEMNTELETFSYSLSHDMRSPLRAMQGYSKALLEDYGPKLEKDAVRWLERIQRASCRLDMLIRDVLACSKVAKEHIDLQPIELAPLLEDIIFQRAEFENMKECITVDAAPYTVLGHEAYLTQCVTNLVSNGLKFVAPGTTPQVRIRSGIVGGKVRLSVTDNGIGINPDHRDRLFKMFGRVHADKRYEGTGIGLAVVRKAIARMGGEAGFESEPGKGSQFWFTLQNASHGQ